MAVSRGRTGKKFALDRKAKGYRYGRHRLSCDIPIRMWNDLIDATERHGIKITRYVITAITERLAREE